MEAENDVATFNGSRSSVGDRLHSRSFRPRDPFTTNRGGTCLRNYARKGTKDGLDQVV
jgi:hypothetical protein